MAACSATQSLHFKGCQACQQVFKMESIGQENDLSYDKYCKVTAKEIETYYKFFYNINDQWNNLYSIEILFNSSFGSILPCLSFSIFQNMSLFCFSISFFMSCLWSSRSSLSLLIISAFVIFSSILSSSFYFQYSWTFIMRSTFYFLSVLLMISQLCFSFSLSSLYRWTRIRFSSLLYNFFSIVPRYSYCCLSLF